MSNFCKMLSVISPPRNIRALLMFLMWIVAPSFRKVAAGNSTYDKGYEEDWIEVLSLDDFNDNFEWNTFCVVREETSELPQMHIYKDLTTGKMLSTDATSHENLGRSDVFIDSSFNETTCRGSSMVWVERISDEESWHVKLSSKIRTLVSTNNNHNNTNNMWVIEINDVLSLHDLPRDTHIHRKVNTSDFFVVAFLTVEAAHDFSTKWHPTSIFPVPDELKLAPSAFILAYPDQLEGLVDDDVAGKGDSDDTVDVLVEIHVPSVQVETNVDALNLTLSHWQIWLKVHNVTGVATTAGSSRILLKLARTDTDLLQKIFEDLLLPEAVVISVEARPRIKLHNQYASAITQNGTMTTGATPIYDQGLTGKGQIVAVADSGLDVQSCFFRDASSSFPLDGVNNLYPDAEKIVQYVAFADNVEGEAGGHGTHVAGSVAAFGGTTGQEVTQGSFDEMQDYAGIAYNAKIAFFDMGIAGSPSLSVPGDITDDFLQLAYDTGARLHTNSWGTDVNSYTSTSRDMDRYCFSHQDFLLFVAAGNTGSIGPGTIGSPATAKNVLAVGASMSNAMSFADRTTGPTCATVELCESFYTDLAANIASFSSLGPTFDGRMKPEVVSVGYFISSAYSSANINAETCAVEAKSGTSMATPVVAGSAALVREYFVDRMGIIPMGALVKAVLIHSATPLTDPDWNLGLGNDFVQLNGLPDTNQGYGLVSLYNVLKFDDSNFELRYLGACSGECEENDFFDMPHVEQGTIVEEVIQVSAKGSVQLCATLVWHDPAASAYTSNSVLINDLDLTIEGPDGSIFYPFLSSGSTGVNTLDNTEKVQIPLESITWGGRYTVRVTGTSVPRGPQPFALVITGPFSGENVGDVVDSSLSAIIQSDDSGLVGVDVFNGGVAAGISVAAFVVLGILITVVVLLQKGKKWDAVEFTESFLHVGAAVRIAAAILALSALSTAVVNTNIAISASTPSLNFAACGGAAPLVVSVGVIVLVNAACAVGGLLHFGMKSPLWFDRSLVVTDTLLILLVTISIVYAAVSTCGSYSLLKVPASLLVAVLALYSTSLCLAYARLHKKDATLNLNSLGSNDSKTTKGAKNNSTQDDKSMNEVHDTAVENNSQKNSNSVSVKASNKKNITNLSDTPTKQQNQEKSMNGNATTPSNESMPPSYTVTVEPGAATSKEDSKPPPLPETEPRNQEVKSTKTVKALYDYQPSNADELALREHDIIQVQNIVDSNMCQEKKTSKNCVGERMNILLRLPLGCT